MSLHPKLALSLVTVALLAGCAEPAAEGATGARLSTPEVAPTGVVRELDLYVRADYTYLIAGSRAYTYRYAHGEDDPGTVPAKEIRVTQGDTVRVRLHSTGDHTIHWHGVRLPWGMDGVPDVTQGVGAGVFTYEFVAKDAGTFWYHCHVEAPRHIDNGMFGAFVVEPADASVDPPFDRETTLFLHEYDLGSYAGADALFKAAERDPSATDSTSTTPQNPFDAPEYALENGAVAYDETTTFGPEYAGQEGTSTRGYLPEYDSFMINGKSFPETDPIHVTSGETMRIRIVNAGQLTHAMHLHGHRFLVTHKDGALLSSPYLADTIGLFPGERYDIYLLADNPGHWDFHDHGGAWGVGAYATDQGDFPGGMATMLTYDDWNAPAELPAPVADALREHAAPSSARTSATPVGGHAAHNERAGDTPARLPIALGLVP